MERHGEEGSIRLAQTWLMPDATVVFLNSHSPVWTASEPCPP
jgi:hypothetical protein